MPTIEPLDPEAFLRAHAAAEGYNLGQPPPPDVVARLPVIE